MSVTACCMQDRSKTLYQIEMVLLHSLDQAYKVLMGYSTNRDICDTINPLAC